MIFKPRLVRGFLFTTNGDTDFTDFMDIFPVDQGNLDAGIKKSVKSVSSVSSVFYF